MNERIQELYEQCRVGEYWNGTHYDEHPLNVEKFAELIIEEHIKLLKNRWYELNNTPSPDHEDPRSIGFRSGRKAEVVYLIEQVKKHYGIENKTQFGTTTTQPSDA